MSSNSVAQLERARARSAWPVRRYSLGTEPEDSLVSSTTAEERLAMMWELAHQAWSLTGRPLPDYPRHRAPGRIVRSAR